MPTLAPPPPPISRPAPSQEIDLPSVSFFGRSLAEYTQFFLSEAMSGQGGSLEAAGMIPQPAEKTAEVLAAFDAGM